MAADPRVTILLEIIAEELDQANNIALLSARIDMIRLRCELLGVGGGDRDPRIPDMIRRLDHLEELLAKAGKELSSSTSEHFH